MAQTSEPAVGIDLGTTNSVIAHLDSDGKPNTILNSEGDLTTPSVIYFHESENVVGKEAFKSAAFEPEHVAQFAKRDMGKSLFSRAIRGEQLPPEVLQALILQKLKSDAQLKLGDFSKAVVTVPAFFNEPRRKATQDAGKLAGLEVLDIINEPTAAAVAYGVQMGFLDDSGEATEPETVLVYDLGGGTFDVTLMRLDGRRYEAIGTAGDVFLGGIDWDRKLVKYLAEQIQAEHGFDPREDPAAKQLLQQEAEDAKRSLTSRPDTTIHFAHDGRRSRIKITRQQFEELTESLVQRTIFTVERLLRDTGKEWAEVDRVLLVGGSTRMPMIHNALESVSGKQVDRSLSPDEAVAHGAAIYAGFLLKQSEGESPQAVITNVSSHDLGVLGVETKTGRKRRHVMIPRNTELPADGRSQFTTFRDDQANVSVKVVEGGDASGNGATSIGKCVITDLPRGLAKGTPVVVSFQYLTNGRLTVTAHLPTANCEATMVIERAAGLSDDAIAEWQARLHDGLVLKAPDAIEDDTEPGDATLPVPVVAEPVEHPAPLDEVPAAIPVAEPLQDFVDVEEADAFADLADDDTEIVDAEIVDAEITEHIVHDAPGEEAIDEQEWVEEEPAEPFEALAAEEEEEDEEEEPAGGDDDLNDFLRGLG